tara:strand:+ start:710 stop:2098 length:1389 start_codon:yes stop_codon:yes gene_type:complete
MRADKTLVAGAAAAMPRTLDMSKFYEGQAKLATQKANNIMKLFATEKETNLNLLKEIKKMTDDIGVYDGGEKAAGFFHGKVRDNAGQTTEENLDDQKYKAKRYKDFRDQVALNHGNLVDLFSNEQNINMDATYSGSLKKAKLYIGDEAIGFYDNSQGLHFRYGDIATDSYSFDVRPSDIKNYFGVVPVMSDTEKSELFKILQKRESKTFNKNDVKSSLYNYISEDRDIRVANLLTAKDLMDNTEGSAADEIMKNFDSIFPDMKDNTDEQKKDFIAQLTQPGHPKYDSNASAEFAVNYYVNVLEQDNAELNMPNNTLPLEGKTIISFKELLSKDKKHVQTSAGNTIPVNVFNQLLEDLRLGNNFSIGLGQYSFDKENKTWSYQQLSEYGGTVGKPKTGLDLEEVKRLVNSGNVDNPDDQGASYLRFFKEFVDLKMDPSLTKKEGEKTIEVEKPKNIFRKIFGL